MLSRKRLDPLVGLALLAGGLFIGAPARAAFTTFETGEVRPLAMSPDGNTLFAVNTPDSRLEIFTISGSGLTHTASVPVGLEPCAVAARSNGEVWVVNHLSDSISIVDVTSSPPRVVRTLLVGDEPRDIVFAGSTHSRAFITTAHRGQNSPIDPQFTTAGVGRADVWVFDAANLGGSLGGTPLTIVTLFGDTPRALAVTPDGGTVYAAVFQSGNRTTTVSEGVVCDTDSTNLNNNTVQGACSIHGVTMPGGLPLPHRNFAGDVRPEVGLIVKFNGTHWVDTLGRNWDPGVDFSLPDKDVFTINANANPPVETSFYTGVGTILFNMAVNPVNGKVYVSNGEAKNETRFEGPGVAGGSTVQGHLSEYRISVLDGSGASARHLNKHIDYNIRPASLSAKANSLATPLEMAVTSNGQTLYVAAFGSAKIGVFDTAQLEADTFVPSDADHIPVSGGGPSGLVLDEARGRLYALTRFDNGVSVIETSTRSEIAHLPLYNPEPTSVTGGRPFLYDAVATSSNGEASCSSCHIFGDFDSLAWDLGNPDDVKIPNPLPKKLQTVAQINGTNVDFDFFHPMKGPMTTQTLRGMAHHGAMHWRGDRADQNGDIFNEDIAFRNFRVAFPGLVGRDGQIAESDMQKFSDFALQIQMPPNPIRNLDNSLTSDQQAGRNFMTGSRRADGIAVGGGFGFNCVGCHTLDPSQGFFGADGQASFENETQIVKVAHLRNMYQKIGMFGMPAVDFFNSGDNGFKGDQIRGFGFIHDGSVDTMFRFLQATVFNNGGTFNPVGFQNDTQRRQVEQFLLAFDSDLAPIVGQQITLTSTNAATVSARITLLLARAAARRVRRRRQGHGRRPAARLAARHRQRLPERSRQPEPQRHRVARAREHRGPGADVHRRAGRRGHPRRHRPRRGRVLRRRRARRRLRSGGSQQHAGQRHADLDRHRHGDQHRHRDGERHRREHRHQHAGAAAADEHRDRFADGDRHSPGHADGDGVGHAHRYPDGHGFGNGDRRQHADRHRHRDGDADPGAVRHADHHADGDAGLPLRHGAALRLSCARQVAAAPQVCRRAQQAHLALAEGRRTDRRVRRSHHRHRLRPVRL